MAATVNLGDHGPAENLAWRTVTVTLDNSYPSGGYAIPVTSLTSSGDVKAVVVTTNPSGFVFHYDKANGKLHAFETGAALSGVLAEVGNGAATLNGVVVTLLVLHNVNK